MGVTRTRAGSPPKPSSRGRPSVMTSTSTWSRRRPSCSRAFEVASLTDLPSASTPSTGVPPPAAVGGLWGIAILRGRTPRVRPFDGLARILLIIAADAAGRFVLRFSYLRGLRQDGVLVETDEA